MTKNDKDKTMTKTKTMTKAKNPHKLSLNEYILDTKKEIKFEDQILDQLNKLNDLFKSGVLTKEEFTKAKKKLLN